MVKPTEVLSTEDSPKDKIIVALDVESSSEAISIARELKSMVGAVKVGMQLFTACGPEIVRDLAETGARVFLDLKFHDIPNTVAKAGIEAARLGVWMFNIHALGGSEMMRRTADEVASVCEKEHLRRPLVVAVTVLTSTDNNTLREIGIDHSADEQVAALAKLASNSGMAGVVASANEVRAIRKMVVNPDFLTVTPGIRPKLATHDDQKRVTTFRQALADGSDYVVIGRPITQAVDRAAAVQSILCELED